MSFELLILLAIFIDLIFGDPRWFPHPVRIIGWFCLFFENFFRKIINTEKGAGIFTSCTILVLTGGGATLLLYLTGLLSETLQTCTAVFMIYTFVAIKDLFAHSKRVYDLLIPHEKIDAARVALGKIVGRETSNLDRAGICKACVETVGENMVDGISAPLFWAIIFSSLALIFPLSAIAFAAIGISLYKAVNTMDSMFGYKNERYHQFGWFSARIDDHVNFLPARLSGICLIIGSFLSGSNWRKSLKIFLRDRMEHSSPNAGQTEAALAGAFDIQLGGSSVYFGMKIKKPTMGEDNNTITPHHILQTHRVVLTSSAVFLTTALLIRKIVVVLL